MRRAIASFLATLFALPFFVRLIEHVAARNPNKISNLHDLDGAMYMRRNWVIHPKSIASRILRLFTPYHSARLHLIKREDWDRNLHNHPFEYRTFVLKGWYREEYLPDATDAWIYALGKEYNVRPSLPTVSRSLLAGDTATSWGNSGYHSVTGVSKKNELGGVLTLFFMTENTGEWGFLDDEGFHETSETYLARKGFQNKGKSS